MGDSDIWIRPPQVWDEFLAAEELQRSIWQMPDWRDVVPANLLITMYKNGGVLLGAFHKNKMVGFLFSFIGSETQNGAMKLKQCSKMMAFFPGYPSQGCGARLNLSQRGAVLSQ